MVEKIARETEKIEKEGNEEKDLKGEVEKIDAELYEKRKKELAEIEARVDKKTKELNDAVDGYKKEGRAFAGQSKDTEEEAKKKEAVKFFEGTQIAEAIKKHG